MLYIVGGFAGVGVMGGEALRDNLQTALADSRAHNVAAKTYHRSKIVRNQRRRAIGLGRDSLAGNVGVTVFLGQVESGVENLFFTVGWFETSHNRKGLVLILRNISSLLTPASIENP